MSVDASSIPVLPRGVRLRHDLARGGYVLLAPERVVKLDDTAYAVVACVDGKRTLGDIAAQLAKEYAADQSLILADITQLVSGLQVRGLLEIRIKAVCP